ncbi:MAG: DUF4340 domain-containing protein [Geminicoccaceae bacterium]
MTPKTFIALAGLTLVATIGAVVTVILQPTTAPVAYVDEPAFSALRAEPDAVGKITIQTKEGTVTLTRTSPETWTSPDRFDYPAANEKINRLVRQLNDMRLIEAKTANAERYGRLEVEDMTEDANSRLIRLEDGEGNVLAEALIGKRLFRLTGSASTGTYIRRPGEDQSWLASGGFELDPEVDAWLEQVIAEIDRISVAKVDVKLAEGDAYSISRKTAEEELTFDGLAEGETLKADANLIELASAMSSVRFDSVKPVTEITWPETFHAAEVITFDGLKLWMQFALIDDKPFATFGASEVPTASGEPVSDVIRQQIESFNNKTVGWVYQINQSLYQRLSKPRDSWVQESDGTS